MQMRILVTIDLTSGERRSYSVKRTCGALPLQSGGLVRDERDESPERIDRDRLHQVYLTAWMNNLAERVLRTVAIGRKNWQFAGSDAGAERAAVIYSLVATCKLCHIDPFAYLRDVLDRVSTHPASQIADLTPAGWAETSTQV